MEPARERIVCMTVSSPWAGPLFGAKDSKAFGSLASLIRQSNIGQKRLLSNPSFGEAVC
jgi:hypothetical protein